MKKLILTSMLVISFLTATATQLSESILYSINDTITKKENKAKTEYYPVIVLEEETDEAFDFNTKDYLPLGFDANKTFSEKFNIVYEVSLEEEDEAFEFDTKKYLPIGFNLSKEILNSIVEINIEDNDEPFDFDTKKYLPKGFNPNKEAIKNNEI